MLAQVFYPMSAKVPCGKRASLFDLDMWKRICVRACMHSGDSKLRRYAVDLTDQPSPNSSPRWARSRFGRRHCNTRDCTRAFCECPGFGLTTSVRGKALVGLLKSSAIIHE